VAFYSGDRRVSCQDVASVVWPQSAVSMDRRNRTRKSARSAPEYQREWGASEGERMGQEEVGRLGERRPNSRPLGVRRNTACQGTVGRGREEEGMGRGLLRKANRCTGEGSGAVRDRGERDHQQILAQDFVTGHTSPLSLPSKR
jgi:hypothetical protein